MAYTHNEFWESIKKDKVMLGFFLQKIDAIGDSYNKCIVDKYCRVSLIPDF